MVTFTEGFHTGEYLVSEADGTLSREEVTVTQTGTALVSGTVMAKLTATGKYVAYDDVGTDGSETAAGVLYTHCAAATGDRMAVVHVRECEVFGGALTGKNANAIADLKALNIIVR